MNTYLKLMLIILSFALYNTAKAQVFPPELSCVKGDTLVWDLPQFNACGSFNAYEIYTSNTLNGPYNLLASITDVAQTNYEHLNPLGQLRYYYMQGNYNCAGETVLSSDTLDNQLPQPFSIERVSVIDGVKVDITWNPSPSPQVTGYIIYRVTEFGTMPVDTVFGVTNYTDQTGKPGLGRETYFVTALDDCDNTSVFDNPHTTMHLTSGASICDRTVTLHWDLYENWEFGIGSQEVWLSRDNGTEERIATIGAADTSYVMEDAGDDSFYCFRVNAIEANTGVVARSSQSCMTIDVITPAEDLMITNVNVNADNEVDLEWMWNTDADIMTYNIERQMVGADILSFDFIAVFPLSVNNVLVDSTALPSLGPVTYQIMADDPCNNPSLTDKVSSIFVQATPNKDKTNRVFWTPFNLPKATVVDYEVYDLNSTTNAPIAILPSTQLDYIDEVNVSNPSNASKCYCIIATSILELPSGGTQTIKTKSNTICVDQLSTIYAPNAFAPYGKNNVFKPVVLFEEAVSEYQMVIFDRWGNKLFESNEISVGWKGRKDGKDMPQGAYTYLIKAKQPNGQIFENRGVVVLIR